MDHHLSYSRVGWAVSIFCALCTIVWFGFIATVTDPRLTILASDLNRLSFPGFREPSAVGIVLAIIEAFVMGWVGALVFAWIYNHTKHCCSPEDLYCETERQDE